jgi:hypothetical protein
VNLEKAKGDGEEGELGWEPPETHWAVALMKKIEGIQQVLINTVLGREGSLATDTLPLPGPTVAAMVQGSTREPRAQPT